MKFLNQTLLFVFFLAGVPTYGQPTITIPEPTPLEQSIKKFERSLTLVDKYYVDTVNTQQLVEKAIIGMLKDLDPHSNYFTKEQIKRANEDLEGSFGGVGVEYQIIQDTIIVFHVNEDGPSEEAGVLPGDRIIRVDGRNATGSTINNNWVSKHLRGEKGTSIQLGVVRPGVSEALTFTVVRDDIPTYSVETYFMLSETTGYIKVTRFMRTTVPEFEKALKELKKEGMESMVLDLRGNSGGYLNSAVQLVDHFLGKNQLIVYTEGVNSERLDYRAAGKGDFKKGKVTVLIDEKTASASEIVTGAIQDWDRGVVIGRRSYGKGLVQKPYKLPDGSAIRLTIARYHTPVGRCIQRPYDKGRDKYYDEVNEKIRKGVYSNIDSLKIPDSLKYYTPNGKMVYGGGGIMPDILVPGDTIQYSSFLKTLMKKNLVNLYALAIAVSEREDILSRYPTAVAFEDGREDLDAFAYQLIAYAAFYGVVPEENDHPETIRNEVRYAFSLALARLLYGVPASIYLTRDHDPDILKALDVIRDADSDIQYKISQESR